MESNISTNTLSENRIHAAFDTCKYRGCPNRRITRGGIHLYHFPTRNDARLTTWVRHAGNKLILNWSPSMLRQAGLCGDHFSDDSFRSSDRTKLKSGAVPEPCEESCFGMGEERSWDHTYCKESAGEEVRANDLVASCKNEPRRFECLDKVKRKTRKAAELPDSRPAWRSNPTFMRTYSRKLSFKDPDDSMEWTAIEPGLPEDNVGELRASEALKQTVAKTKTAAADALIEEHHGREIRELRMINMELRRQNKILRVENFKLQLRLAAATCVESET